MKVRPCSSTICGELGVLGQEADSGVDRIGSGDGRRRRWPDVEIAVARGRRPDAHAFVGQPHMHGVGVGGGMDRHGVDTHLAAGAVDPEGDFASIGDEDLLEHAMRHLNPIDHQDFAELDRAAVADHDVAIVPPCGPRSGSSPSSPR